MMKRGNILISIGIHTILESLVPGKAVTRLKTKHYTYMVRCRGGVLYTGYTNNLEKRIEAHNRGEGAKFTRGRRPVELVYFEEYSSKGEAMSREAQIKHLTRPQKLKLIAVMESDGEYR